MDACFPIAMDGSMTASTEGDDVVLGNLGSIVMFEGVPILRVVAVEAKLVVSMIELDGFMLDPQPIHFPLGVQ